MKTQLSIIAIIIMSMLFLNLAEAQKKSTKVKVDPEFEKFWKEFKTALGKNDKSWFENNTAFPLITLAECEAMGGMISKKDYFENWRTVEKKELNKINKIKISKAEIFKKQKDTYSVLSENGQDPAKHIPNGSTLISIGYKDGECYVFSYFAIINKQYKYIGYGSCCPEGQ